MAADSFGQTNLTNHTANDIDAAWSPDGSKIAFTSDRDGNREIYVMSSTGGSPTRLTNNAAQDFRPTWSLASPPSAASASTGQTLTCALE